MIITCNNCNKKFDLDSNLIPDTGRLLQCVSCDYKWFFKKEFLENTASAIVEDTDNDTDNIFDQNNLSKNKEINLSNLPKNETEVDTEEVINEEIEINTKDELEKINDVNKNEDIPVKDKQKKLKNFKILNLLVVILISLVALIIILDTFKFSIGKIVPNIELLLYNLFESLKDISLFFKDLF